MLQFMQFRKIILNEENLITEIDENCFQLSTGKIVKVFQTIEGVWGCHIWDQDNNESIKTYMPQTTENYSSLYYIFSSVLAENNHVVGLDYFDKRYQEIIYIDDKNFLEMELQFCEHLGGNINCVSCRMITEKLIFITRKFINGEYKRELSREFFMKKAFPFRVKKN